MRAPALPIAAAFVAGLAAPGFPPLPIGFLLAGLSLAAAAALSRRDRAFAASVFLLSAFCLLGGIAQRLARIRIERQPLLRTYQELGEACFEAPCLIEGRLVREPELKDRRATLALVVDHLTLGTSTSSCRGGVQLTVRGESIASALTGYGAGDRIRLWARLRRPRGFLNPGCFDVEAHLARSGITLQGSVKSALLVEQERPGPSLSIARLGSGARRFVRDRIDSAFSRVSDADEGAGVLLAMLVGDRSRIPPRAEKLYQEAGTFHVIAISGAHVALLALLIYGALRKLGLDERPSLLVLAAVLPAYAVICGGAASVVRAVLMGLVFIGAKLLSLDAAPANGLGLSALLLLAARPLDLADPGFQLSFVATATIVAFAGPLIAFLQPRMGRLAQLVAVSLAAQAGVLPIIAWHFQRVTPAALAANVVAVPIAAALLVAGAALLLLAPVPLLGEALAHGVRLLVKGLSLSSQAAVAIPGGTLRIPAPGPAWMAGYLAGLAAAFVFRGILRRGSIGLLGFLTLLLLVDPRSPGPSPLLLTAIDVGHGDSLLLELPGGARLLIDGGGSYDRSFDIGEQVVVPFLLHRGVRELDAIVLTHPDLDHLGGLPAVVSNLRVGEIWEGRPGWALETYRELRARARAREVPVRRLRAGEEMALGDVKIEVLAAGSAGRGERRGRNDESVVLRFSYGGVKILLTGDGEAELERQLLHSGRPLRADVLKVAHHGSGSSTTASFLDAVRPRLALISSGGSPAFPLPSKRVIHRLRSRGIEVYRTDRDGAVTVRIDQQGEIRVTTFRDLDRESFPAGVSPVARVLPFPREWIR